MGDLAVIVRDPDCGGRDIGKIVQIVGWDAAIKEWDCTSTNPLWSASTKRLVTEIAIPDEFLRPIRPDEGTDETLTWKELPHKETA